MDAQRNAASEQFAAIQSCELYVKPVSKPRRWLAGVLRRAAQLLDKSAAPVEKKPMPIPDWRF